MQWSDGKIMFECSKNYKRFTNTVLYGKNLFKTRKSHQKCDVLFVYFLSLLSQQSYCVVMNPWLSHGTEIKNCSRKSEATLETKGFYRLTGAARAKLNIRVYLIGLNWWANWNSMMYDRRAGYAVPLFICNDTLKEWFNKSIFGRLPCLSWSYLWNSGYGQPPYNYSRSWLWFVPF